MIKQLIINIPSINITEILHSVRHGSRGGNGKVCLFVCQLFGPPLWFRLKYLNNNWTDWHTCCADIHGSQMMYPNDFGDPLMHVSMLMLTFSSQHHCA